MKRLAGPRAVVAYAAMIATALVASIGVGCSRESAAESSAVKFATTLSELVTPDAMMSHLAKLQEIADVNSGNRSLGSPGYDASVDYVVNALRSKGFEVQTPEYEARLPYADDPLLTVNGTAIAADPLQFTTGTPGRGISGPLLAAPAEQATGCDATAYDGLPVKGAVILVDRGACRFEVKQAIVAERGAVAMIVVDNVDQPDMGGTLTARTDAALPVLSVSKAEGARLQADGGHVTIALNAGIRVQKFRNVIAQTKTGSASDVVMLGAHLDSVPWGPGINDNGSGVAALLETALQLGSMPEVKNAVRFSFWGAEEAGLIGSRSYIEQLDGDELKNIALYLNFDMLGSPNPGYFLYKAAEGSTGIHSAFSGYLRSAGKMPQDIGIQGRADDEPFSQAGIPTGGIFSGADTVKTEEQAQLWGGRAGEEFDPNYHKSTDTLTHVDRGAMRINGGGVAYAAGLYAQYLDGRYGVPSRNDRVRRVRPCSATADAQPASCNCVVAIRNGVPAWSCASSI